MISFLDGRRIAFIKNAEEKSDFRFTYTISFDANFCSYLRNLVSETLNASLRNPFVAALDYLYPHREALDIVPYLNEAIRTGSTEKVRESIDAYCLYRYSDEFVFRSERRLTPACHESDFQEKLAGVHSMIHSRDWAKVSEQFYWHHLEALIVLAAGARAYLEKPSADPCDQYRSVLSLLHSERGVFPQFELFAIQRLISEARLHRFFGPVNSRSSRLLPRLRAMAWDLSHLRTIFLWSAFNSRMSRLQAPFPVPYFASFDGALTSLVELLRLNAIIYQRVGNRPHFVQIHKLANVQKGSTLMSTSAAFLTSEAKAERRKRVEKVQSTSTLEEIANKLIALLPHD